MFMPHSAGYLVADTHQMAFSGQRLPIVTVGGLFAKRDTPSLPKITGRYVIVGPYDGVRLGEVAARLLPWSGALSLKEPLGS